MFVPFFGVGNTSTGEHSEAFNGGWRVVFPKSSGLPEVVYWDGC